MEAASDTLLGHGYENAICKSRGSSTFKIYFGLKRKAVMIACLQQRRRIIAENRENEELLYLKDPSALDDKMDNKNSHGEEHFSDGSMDIREVKATEDTFKVATLSLFHQNLKQKQESKASSNESELHAIFPKQKPNLQSFAQSTDTLEIKAIENNFEISTLNLLQKNLQHSQESPAFSNDSPPEQNSKLHRAVYTYEYLELPRMAIVLPKPLKGRTVWMDPITNHFPTQLYLALPHTTPKKVPPQDEIWGREQLKRIRIREQLQKILNALANLQIVADGSLLRAQIPGSSYKAIDVILLSLLIILTLVVFYFIWTCPLPEEILVTLSGMYTLLISYIYFLLYN